MGSCGCGKGGCGGERGGQETGAGRNLNVKLLAILATVGIGIGGISAVAITQPTAPPAPKAPAAPSAPKAPAAPIAPSVEPAKPDIVTPGVIRHGSKDPIARPKDFPVVRVATYNLENLFGPVPEGKAEDASRRGAQPKPVEHQKAVAEAIKRIDADILAVEEIESLETLTTFRDTYLADLGYAHIASLDAGDERGIEQSVLSRHPITEVKNWVHLPIGGTHPENRMESDRTAGGAMQFKRSPLRVTVEVPPAKGAAADAKPYRVTLFVCHFKSGGRDGYWREKEAAKTAELAREMESADPTANVLILGDFNARPQDKPCLAFTRDGFIDAFGDRPDGDVKYITHASDRAIDHIMLNANAAAEVVKETRFVLGTLQRPSNANWQSTPPPAGYGSDHYPVVIDLRTTDQPVAAAPATPAPTTNDKPATPAAKPETR